MLITNSKKNLFIYLFIYLFIPGCAGSSFLCKGLLQLRRAGAILHRGARASHRRGLSRRGAQAPDTQAQQLWLTGPAAPQHVGSSQTRARTRVPCIGRQILNPCATREAPPKFLTLYRPNTLCVCVGCFLWDSSLQPLLYPSGLPAFGHLKVLLGHHFHCVTYLFKRVIVD